MRVKMNDANKVVIKYSTVDVYCIILHEKETCYQPEGTRENTSDKESWETPELSQCIHDKEWEELITLGHQASADGVTVHVTCIYNHPAKCTGDHQDKEAHHVDPKSIDGHLLSLHTQITLNLYTQ